MLNKILLIGNLTRDVSLKYTTGGSAIAKFGIAVNRRWKDKNTGETKDEVMFIDITVFGRSAEIANQYLKKGSKVLVEGRLQLETWTDSNNQKRSKHGVVSEQLQFLDSKEDSAGYSDNNNGGGYNQPGQNSYNNDNYNNNQGGYSNQQQNSYQKPPKTPHSAPIAPIEEELIPF